MRTARLVGLSPDGRYVIVATDRGEELAIAADDRLRAALRGDRPRLGQLEIEMESALSPREIQTRIRSGESVEDVARVAGVDRERVERFAAPVIAERDHVAGLAMGSSARRRGETSAHRTLRGVLHERLLSRGVELDTVEWDSYRVDDGRWAITADYRSGDTPRQALFYFDLPGRFSVAGNDEGRWVLGDVSPSRGPQPGRRPPAPGESDEDTEPTLDLSDELALVRAIQDIPLAPRAGSDPGVEAGAVEVPVEVTEMEVTIAEVVQLTRVPDPASPGVDDLDAELEEINAELDRLEAEEDREPTEDSGPSDAAAVPELGPSLRSQAWEPAIVVDYPVEPGEDADGIEVPEGSDDPARPEPAVAGQDRRDEAATLDLPLGEPAQTTVETAAVTVVESETVVTEPEDQPLPLDVPEPAPAVKPARRKRPSVPSWDEIVFGGPKDT